MNNIITVEERTSLVNKIIDLLKEYDYTPEHDAICSIVDEWASQKENLIEAFKRSENYIEGKFMIAFSKNFERPINKREAAIFFDWVIGARRENYSAGRGELSEEFEKDRQPWELLPDRIYGFIKDYSVFSETNISDEAKALLDEKIPELHVHSGQKTSRVVNKLCEMIGVTKHPDYNKKFAKYADSLSPMVIKRHTVLSINPLDYLTMSFGNSWASCHTIDKENRRGMPNNYSGCYSSGTISYMLDPSSMVFYTVEDDYDGDEYYTQPKVNRQMFHYQNEKLVQGRLYPQGNDGFSSEYKKYRNIVQEIISKIYDFPNLWTCLKGTSKCEEHISSAGTHYRDYENFSDCNISILKDSKNEYDVEIGNEPICIECGERHDTEDNISCCAGTVKCVCCGDRIDEDYATWVDYENGYICSYCEENYYNSCSDCGDLYPCSELTEVDDEGTSLCPTCYEQYRMEHKNDEETDE